MQQKKTTLISTILIKNFLFKMETNGTKITTTKKISKKVTISLINYYFHPIVDI
jgi:hypothetical protein